MQVCAAFAGLALAVVSAACLSKEPMQTDNSDAGILMYVGTYTKETSAGIYLYRFDPSTGVAQEVGLAAEMRDPSFLAVHPGGRFLYAVSEIDDFDSEGSGAVLSFAIEPGTGELQKLNAVSSKGGWPCHLSVDRTGSMLIVANYSGGSVASFAINEDGTLGEAASFFQHVGSSVHSRQEQAHAHSADFSADGRFAFFSDLGLDEVKVYRADSALATIAPNEPPHVKVEPGSGPRHFSIHPSGKFAYVINELASTVTAFSLDGATGFLEALQTVSTLPAGFEGENYTAEISVHPSGRFLYGSNRGHDSIAIFEIDPATGRIEARGHASTRGRTPRSFALDPTGRYLLAANQATDSISVFHVDEASGALEPTGTDLVIDAPVCVVFATGAAESR